MVRNSSDIHRSFHSNTDPQHFRHQSPHISNLVCYTQLGSMVCVPSTYKIGELISLHLSSSPNVKSPYETSALSSSAKVPSSSLKPVCTSVANETNISTLLATEYVKISSFWTPKLLLVSGLQQIAHSCIVAYKLLISASDIFAIHTEFFLLFFFFPYFTFSCSRYSKINVHGPETLSLHFLISYFHQKEKRQKEQERTVCVEKENGNRLQHKKNRESRHKTYTMREKVRVPPSQQHKKRGQENAKRTLMLCVCVCVCVRERERERHTRTHTHTQKGMESREPYLSSSCRYRSSSPVPCLPCP